MLSCQTLLNIFCILLLVYFSQISCKAFNNNVLSEKYSINNKLINCKIDCLECNALLDEYSDEINKSCHQLIQTNGNEC